MQRQAPLGELGRREAESAHTLHALLATLCRPRVAGIGLRQLQHRGGAQSRVERVLNAPRGEEVPSLSAAARPPLR